MFWNSWYAPPDLLLESAGAERQWNILYISYYEAVPFMNKICSAAGKLVLIISFTEEIMSLRFIIGNSGSGKSYAAFSHIIEEAGKHPEQMYYVIVPEQFTMQTQKTLVEMHPDRGILNIDVLSFDRLAYRVLEEAGEIPGSPGGNGKKYGSPKTCPELPEGACISAEPA